MKTDTELRETALKNELTRLYGDLVSNETKKGALERMKLVDPNTNYDPIIGTLDGVIKILVQQIGVAKEELRILETKNQGE